MVSARPELPSVTSVWAVRSMLACWASSRRCASAAWRKGSSRTPGRAARLKAVARLSATLGAATVWFTREFKQKKTDSRGFCGPELVWQEIRSALHAVLPASTKKKAAPVARSGFRKFSQRRSAGSPRRTAYFFFAGFLAAWVVAASSSAACAAARRATGTRKGEQLT